MIDPNKSITDPQKTAAGEDTTPNADLQGGGGTTPPAITPDNVVRRDDVYKHSEIEPGDASSTTAAAPVSTSMPAQYTASSYAELIPQLEKRMNEYKPLSEDDLKKLRRRQKAEGIISGISDAVQSVANLVFTHHYAPNMYNPKEGMSAKAKERFDRLKAEREADEEKYYNYAMTIGRLKDAQEQKTYQRGRDALQDGIRESQENRAQLKADRDAAMAELRMELMQGKISQQVAAAEAKRIEAEYADRYWNARIEKENSQAKKNEAQAKKDDRWQPLSGGRGRYYGTFNGVRYESKADYEKAVSESAKRHSVSQTETRTSTSGNGFDKKTSKRTVNRKTSDVARDAERAERNGKKNYSNTRKLGL